MSNLEKKDYSIDKNDDMRDGILKLQDVMIEMSDGTELDMFPVDHFFAPGVYARSMRLPAGYVIIGKIHKHAHLNIISYGHVMVATEEGAKELKGPLIFTSPAGVKRAVTVLEDTMWTTIHVTEETELEKIEDDVIAKSFQEFEKHEATKLIGDQS